MSKLEFVSNASSLLYGGERHLLDSAVIVLNGHTYHLVVDITKTIYNPCKRCALEPLCTHEGKESIIERLCKECTPNGAGYWVEDRYPIQYTLEKICENQNYPGYDLEYHCYSFDRPMFVKFDK